MNCPCVDQCQHGGGLETVAAASINHPCVAFGEERERERERERESLKNNGGARGGSGIDRLLERSPISTMEDI